MTKQECHSELVSESQNTWSWKWIEKQKIPLCKGGNSHGE